jgi:O-methyltransferase involved in polyketide biosynthesis
MYGEERLYKKYVVKDKIWLFGMNSESVPSFLKEHGWKIIEDLGYGELAERYIKPTGRILSSTPIERVVYAEKL